MIHRGPEPPWRGVSQHYGSWRWIPADERLWTDEDGRWEYVEPPNDWNVWGLSNMLKAHYTQSLVNSLNNELIRVSMTRTNANL
jgi:hypothetical protein